MKVLWITTFPPRRCGVGDYSADLASRLSRAEGLELRIVTYPDGAAGGVTREDGFEVSRSLRGSLSRGAITAEFRAFRPDVAHLQSSSFLHAPSINVAVAEKCEVPLVTTVHDTPGSWRAFRAIRGLRKVYAKSSRILIHSVAIANTLSTFHAVDERKIVEVPHGVDLSKYSPGAPAGEALRWYGLQGRRIVLFFGFLRPGKGIEILLQAWSKIAASFSDTVLVIAGGTPTDVRRYDLLLRSETRYPSLLKRLATQLRISERTIFTGYVPADLAPGLLASAELVVLPYAQGVNQSGPLHKSLASGRAIVATNIGGFRELLEDGKDSVLVPPGKPEPLADAIKALLDDPGRARGLARRAREKAEQTLGWEVVSDQTLGIYRQLS